MTLCYSGRPFISLYNYVRLCKTQLDIVWLCMTLCDSVWPFITLNDSFGISFTNIDCFLLQWALFHSVLRLAWFANNWFCIIMFDLDRLCLTRFFYFFSYPLIPINCLNLFKMFNSVWICLWTNIVLVSWTCLG